MQNVEYGGIVEATQLVLRVFEASKGFQHQVTVLRHLPQQRSSLLGTSISGGHDATAKNPRAELDVLFDLGMKPTAPVKGSTVLEEHQVVEDSECQQLQVVHFEEVIVLHRDTYPSIPPGAISASTMKPAAFAMPLW